MDTTTYLDSLRGKLNSVFDKTVLSGVGSGQSLYYSSCLFDFAEQLVDDAEKKILKSVCAQIQGADLMAAFGLYRQAFSSLRLALEMGLSAAYFSIHRLELNEWLDGREDIHWHRLIDEDRGVLSTRFANAFFPELAGEVKEIKMKAMELYRQLSEFVHGNFETWESSGIKIEYNLQLYEKFQSKAKDAFEIVMFVLCCLHAKSLNSESLDSLGFVSEEFSHIGAIREIFGGPKDI